MTTQSAFPFDVSTTPAALATSYVERPPWIETAEYYFQHVLTVLQFFGFGLNILHFLILTCKELRSNAVYRLMIGICFFDMISQISTFLLWSPFLIRTPPTPEEKCYLTFTYFDIWTQVYARYALDSSQRNSSWLALLMALFRVLLVMFPINSLVQKLSKPRVAVITVVVVSTISVAWTLEAYSRFAVKAYYEDTNCDGVRVILSEPRYSRIIPSELQEAHNHIVSIYGLVKALPSLIDLILAILLIYELRKAKKRRLSIQKIDQSKKDNTTKLVLFMTMSFFTLEVPNGISHIVTGFSYCSRLIFSIMYYVQVFAEILPTINSSSQIFVCFLMSSQYRETARNLFGISNMKKAFLHLHSVIYFSMNTSVTCASGFLNTPVFLSIWEHTVTILATPIHIFGFYCIIYKTPSSMATVKWSLLNLHLWTILLDYSFSLLVIPFIMWPIMGGVPLGVLKDTGVSTRVQFYVLMVLMGLVAVSILSMFEGRFNILFIKRDEFWSRARTPWLSIHYIASFLYMAPPFLDNTDQRELLILSLKSVPCLPNFISTAPLFVLSLDIVYSTLAIGLFTIDIVIEVLFFFSLIYSKILKQLNSQSMSTRTFKLQRLLLISLFIQVLIPLNLFIFPIIYVTYATIFGVHNQALNNLSIAVASTHGICSTLVMILIHRPYRTVVLKVFGVRREIRTEVNSAKVSVVIQMN